MSTKFFNNGLGNTLFDKLKGIASEMATFDRFLAVVGFFRSSGYFKLRKELGDISEIKILVGINIDDIFRKHNKALLMLADEEKAKEMGNHKLHEWLREIDPKSAEKIPENNVKRALVDHYNTILVGNAKINTEKAEAVAAGIKYSIIAFALLSLSSITLIIMIGGI